MQAFPRSLILYCWVCLACISSSSAAEIFTELWRRPAFNAAAFSPDETVVAAAVDEGAIALLSITNGTLITSWTAHSNIIWRLEFSPDGQYLVSSSNERNVKVFRYSDRHLVYALPTERSDPPISFSPDSSMLAVGISSTNIALYSASSGQRIRSWKASDGPYASINTIQFTADGKQLASGSGLRGFGIALNMWDVATGALLWSNRTSQTYGVGSISISPDGKSLATASRYLHLGSVLEVWDPQTGALQYTLPRVMLDAAFSPQAPVLLNLGTNLSLFSLPPKLLRDQRKQPEGSRPRVSFAFPKAAGTFSWLSLALSPSTKPLQSSPMLKNPAATCCCVQSDRPGKLPSKQPRT